MLESEERAKKRAEIAARVAAARAAIEADKEKTTCSQMPLVKKSAPAQECNMKVVIDPKIASKNQEMAKTQTQILSNMLSGIPRVEEEENEEDQAETQAICNRLLTTQDPDEIEDFLTMISDKARAYMNVALNKGPGNQEWEWRMHKIIRSIQRGDLQELKSLAELDPTMLHMPMDIPGISAGNCAHLACNLGNMDIVKYIYAGWPETFRRGDVNYGNRAVHGAAAHGQAKVLEFLLEHEPTHFMSKNKRGQLARDLAKGHEAKAFFKSISKEQLESRVAERRKRDRRNIGESLARACQGSMDLGDSSLGSFIQAMTATGFINHVHPQLPAVADQPGATLQRVPLVSFSFTGSDGVSVTGKYPPDEQGLRFTSRAATVEFFPRKGDIVRISGPNALVGEVVEIVPSGGLLGRCGLRESILRNAGRTTEINDRCTWLVVPTPAQGLWDVGKSCESDGLVAVRARAPVYVVSYVSADQTGAAGAYALGDFEPAAGTVGVQESEKELFKWSLDDVIAMLRSKGIWTKHYSSKLELISRLFYFAAEDVD